MGGAGDMATLMLVDDDAEVLEINRKYLTNEGYEVLAVSNPLKAVATAKHSSPDCIILDVMMPVMNGFELCEQLRTFSTAPIIFLTGRSSEEDKINGLMTGADDYIVKPYSLKELKARIDVLLRRVNMLTVTPSKANLITIGELSIDIIAHKAFYMGEDLLLANREYEVLLYMSEHPNRTITFEELGTKLFGIYSEPDRRLVMVNVSRLRKKMSIDTALSDMIETVWSKGYKFRK